MTIDLLHVAQIGGLSGSVLTLFCLLGLVVSGFYLATTTNSVVMERSRRFYYTFFAFLLVGVFLAGTSGGYAAYGGFPMRP